MTAGSGPPDGRHSAGDRQLSTLRMIETSSEKVSSS